MSSRGGRGGRGRGRFGGVASAAQLYLKRSAQESGLDDRNLTTLQAITRPALFPDYVWHSSGQINNNKDAAAAIPTTTANNNSVNIPLSQPVRTPSTTYLIQKGRDLQHRLQSSSHYVRLTSAVDVIRYGKGTVPVHADQAFLQDCSAAYRTDQRYLPRELIGKEPSKKRQKVATLGASALLDDLETQEEQLQLSPSHIIADKNENDDDDAAVPKKIKVEGEEGENLSETGELDVDDEEEEVEDYTTNYYESAEEGSDGGGGGEGADEAVF